MADITEAEQWDTGVYQLETTDPVQGGADGVDNIPHKALANRTVWLKAQVALKALLGGSATQLFKAAAGIANDDVVNKGQLDTKIDLATANTYDLGVGQTWQNMLTIRNSGVNYTNTTGKPIMVFARSGVYAHSNFGVVDGVEVGNVSNDNGRGGIIFPVPNGSVYSIIGDFNVWSELR